MVCSITRAPAKPMTAPGSASVMSPSMANDAETPPVVGSVSTTMYGSPAERTSSTATVVRAICISERIPSCMRAPPDAATTTSAARSATADRAAVSSPSPTATPIEPPMNSKSIAATTTGWPPIVPAATFSASGRAVFVCASLSRSAYRLTSRNLSGSAVVFGSSTGRKPSSSSIARRSLTPSRRWWPQS